MLFLSIHPSFVRKILSGEKTVELRRQRPRCKAGDWIAIYATTPERCLCGIVQVREVQIGEVDEMWQSVRKQAGVTRDQYDTYFTGSKQAVGIVLENPRTLPAPVSLSELRRVWPEFHPPQSFRYLNEDQIEFVNSQVGSSRYAA